jgi:hypothetical protein
VVKTEAAVDSSTIQASAGQAESKGKSLTKSSSVTATEFESLSFSLSNKVLIAN